jgi:small subunit ribosomal protein S7|uniref:Ribosomal protein S7 n=1 Tax=Galdieria yellowstonensis TaxID=3028027 RepID=A0A9Y1I328_9RHOD|nr:ribosomal protein S7 [Galdieria yellowstonensis]
MSRKTIANKNFADKDAIHKSRLVSMLINRIIKNGKKSLAQRITYTAMDLIQDKTHANSIKILEKAVKNVTPLVEVKGRRIGGSTYQVPIEVKTYRGTNLALRWLINAAKKRTGKNIIVKLSNEIIDASNYTGNAIRKKEEVHKMAEANRAFAHYRY